MSLARVTSSERPKNASFAGCVKVESHELLFEMIFNNLIGKKNTAFLLIV